MEDRPLSPLLHLDLNNFDRPEAEDCRYVLTSPRSLEACAKLSVKPVELLFKTFTEFLNENKDAPVERLTTLYEANEKERLRLLRLCRLERQKLIEEGKSFGSSIKQGLPSLETVLENVSDCQSALPSRNRIDVQKKLVSKSAVNLGHQRLVSFTEKATSLAALGDHLGPKNDSQFLGPRNHIGTGSSLSLGDLRHSSTTERQLEKLTRDIQRKLSITVPEKDRKIAALMLVKHEDEQSRMQLSFWEERQRREEQQREKEQQSRVERLRRKELLRSIRQWQEGMEVRRRQRKDQNEQQAGRREQEMVLHEERWRRLAVEQESLRKERMRAAKREAEERKHYQEQHLHQKERDELQEREREWQLAQRKEQRARRSRRLQERRERRRLRQDNDREHLRHMLMQREVQLEAHTMEEAKRRLLDQKLTRSGQNRAQLLETRLLELRRRAALEDEQIRQAQQRAGWQSRQLLREKRLLAQLGHQRQEQAAQRVRLQRSSRVQQLRQENQRKELSHKQLREQVQRQEEVERELRQMAAQQKQRRCERLQQEREQQQRESRKVAQASFHMRERVREETCSRSFNKMALEAELFSSLGRLKL